MLMKDGPDVRGANIISAREKAYNIAALLGPKVIQMCSAWSRPDCFKVNKSAGFSWGNPTEDYWYFSVPVSNILTVYPPPAVTNPSEGSIPEEFSRRKSSASTAAKKLSVYRAKTSSVSSNASTVAYSDKAQSYATVTSSKMYSPATASTAPSTVDLITPTPPPQSGRSSSSKSISILLDNGLPQFTPTPPGGNSWKPPPEIEELDPDSPSSSRASTLSLFCDEHLDEDVFDEDPLYNENQSGFVLDPPPKSRRNKRVKRTPEPRHSSNSSRGSRIGSAKERLRSGKRMVRANRIDSAGAASARKYHRIVNVPSDDSTNSISPVEQDIPTSAPQSQEMPKSPIDEKNDKPEESYVINSP